MCACDRRSLIILFGCALAARTARAASALGEMEKGFVAEAFRMKREAEAGGDQPFGAVVVRAGEIIGYGPSRVIADRNSEAHAERVALWEAQRRSGTTDLTGAVIYSTSRSCAACEHALALSNIERMFFGLAATDAGRPRRR